MARSKREFALDPPYDKIFGGVLSFKTFADAERTLRVLEELRKKYLAEKDDKGCRSCRLVALAGRRRAEAIGRNRRVDEVKRRQKSEMSFWFKVWLETPELFDDWLAMRKSSPEFKALSGEDGGGWEVQRDGEKR